MVADDDKNGEEYHPEVSGVEHPEEISEDEYSPVREEEPVASTAVQERSSPLKKLGVAIVLIVAVFAVASYLTHKKKVRLAEQSETTAIVSNSNAAPEPNNNSESAKSDQAKKADVAENKPADKPEIKPEVQAQKAAPVPAPVPEVVALNKESSVKTQKTEAVMPMNSKQLEDSAAKMAMAADTSTATKTETSTVTTTVIPATTSDPEIATTPVVTPVSSDTDKQISALKDQAKTNDNKLNDLNTRVINLDNAISKLNNSISALDKKIGDMTVVSKIERKPIVRERIVVQKRPLHPVIFERNHPRHKMMNMEMNEVVNTAGKSRHENFDKIAYSVRAIVPGRAWVESPSGYKFSISVGDKVLGYGTVTQINADYGEVTFDGGDVIKYGSDDH